jgi:hypothetical protein
MCDGLLGSNLWFVVYRAAMNELYGYGHNKTPWPLVLERTIPPLVGEI